MYRRHKQRSRSGGLSHGDLNYHWGRGGYPHSSSCLQAPLRADSAKPSRNYALAIQPKFCPTPNQDQWVLVLTRCQGPLSLVGCYNIHQEDQRSDLSMFLSDLRLLEVSRLRANMIEASDRERQHNSKSARTHTCSHTTQPKNIFLRTCQQLHEHIWWGRQRWLL